MPQLMPLMWLFSSLMILMMLLVFLNIFYLKLNDFLDLSMNEIFIYNFKIKW